MSGDLLSPLLGTLIGGAIAAVAGSYPMFVNRRDRKRKSLRTWRNDFYHDQHKLAIAILSTNRWWGEEQEIERLALIEDIGEASKRLTGAGWNDVAGTRRRMRVIENRRCLDVRRSEGEPAPARTDGEPTNGELYELYELMETTRETLSEKKPHLKRHPTKKDFERHPTKKAVDAKMTAAPMS